MKLLLVVCSLLLLSNSQAQASDDRDNRLLFEAPLFKIDATIKLIDGDTYSNRQIQLSEMCSSERCVVRTDCREAEASAFYTLKRTNLILRLGQDSGCSISNGTALAKALFGHLLTDQWASEWAKERPEVDMHLRGLAGFLQLVERRRDRLQRINGQAHLSIRNIPVNSFRFQPEYGVLDDVLLYFARSNQSEKAVGLPLQIYLNQPKHMFVIRIQRAVAVAPEPLEASSTVALTQIDPLSWPVGAGCAPKVRARLGYSAAPQFPDEGDPSPGALSFRARVIDRSGGRELPQERHLFFAYSYHLRASRLDSLPALDTVTSSRGHPYTTTIHDLAGAKRYQVRYKGGQSATSCLASESDSDTNYDLANIFDELVEMGSARVRGQPARLYEQTNDRLPLFLFPEFDFRDKKTNNMLKNQQKLFVAPFWQVSQEPAKPLSVLYLFADRIKPDRDQQEEPANVADFGDLLQVIVLADGRTVLIADIEELSWSLEDAPNGDKADQLFALEDKCCHLAGICSPSRMARLETLLSLNWSPPENPNTDSNPDKLIQILSRPATRNGRLAAGLVSGAVLSAVQINQVESRLLIIHHYNQQQVMVDMSARLSEPQVPTFEARLVGYTLGWRAGFDTAELTADQCFWEAANKARRSSRQTLFTFCSGKCVVDRDAALKEGKRWISQILVDKDKPNNCPTFLVVANSNKQPSNDRTNWLKVYSKLAATSVAVPLVTYYEESATFTWCTLQTVKLELRSDRWLASERHKSGNIVDTNQTRLVLGGVAFARQSEGGLGELLEGNVNRERCQAACLAKMGCNSHSFCQLRTGNECYLSTLKLDSEPDLVAAIRDGLANKQLGQSELQVSLKNERALFRLHSACEIIERKPMDMFAPTSFSVESADAIRQSKVVDDVQHCAFLCLSKNLAFSRRQFLLRGQNLTRNWCSGFAYADKLVGGGLCLLNSAVHTTDQELNGGFKQGPMKEEHVEFEWFHFLFNQLYERHYAKRLSRLLDTDGQHNQQVVLDDGNVEDCARKCFSQLVKLEFGCRSFDLITVAISPLAGGPANKDRQRSHRSYCVLNTLSSKDISSLHQEGYIQSDDAVVDETVSEHATIVHYEPYDPQPLEFWRQPVELLEDSAGKTRQDRGPTLGVAACCLVVLLAAASGFCGSLLIYRKLKLGDTFGNDDGTQTRSDDSSIPHKRFQDDDL